MNKRLFFSAGEISGDIHSANLIRELKKLDPSLIFVGNGGKNMLREGVRFISEETVTHSAIGLTDSLRFMNFHSKIWKITTNYLKENKVMAVILVDHQGFNIPLAKFCKKLKIPVYYYFPPHVSIWGKWNAPKLARYVNALFVTFYDDYLVYKKYTDKAFYYGHPILENIENFRFDEGFYEKYKIDRKKKIIGIFPGSRYQEVNNLTEIMLKSVNLISKNIEAEFIVSSAHPDFFPIISKKIEKYGLNNIKLIENEAYSIMKASDLIIAASGTTTLESAIFEKPVIICYKISNLSFFLGSLLVKKKMIGMPNIILDKKVFPELLQKECNEYKISDEALRLINMGEDERKIFLNNCRIIKEKLGSPPILRKVAEKILMDLKNGQDFSN
ncbi:MAG: lipid-A-disaccharide synthase [Brevinematia bacterium]